MLVLEKVAVHQCLQEHRLLNFLSSFLDKLAGVEKAAEREAMIHQVKSFFKKLNSVGLFGSLKSDFSLIGKLLHFFRVNSLCLNFQQNILQVPFKLLGLVSRVDSLEG